MTARDGLELLVLGAIWGASFLFMRVAAPELGPAALIEIRLVVAATFLTTWLALREGLGGLRGRWRDLAILGATNSAIPFSLFAFATLSLPAGLASVLNATTPMFAVTIGFLWLRDRIEPRRLLGLAVGFAGVLILVWPKLSLAADRTAVCAGLAAAALYGFATHFTKRRLAGLSALTISAGSLCAASVLLLPVALAFLPSALPSPRALLFAFLLGIVCTGLAYVFYFRLLRSIGPSRAVTVTYLIPLFGLLWGFVFLDERLSPLSLAGAAIVLLGTTLVVRRPPVRAGAAAPLPLPPSSPASTESPSPCPTSPPTTAR